MDIKYVHTNLIAMDWRSLADFYIKVFNCKPQYPERDLAGIWVDKLTNINNARIKGIHLTLPGYEDNGPTLEIFEYEPCNLSETAINKHGYGHIAFQVESVEELMESIIHHGGKLLGEIVEKDYGEMGLLKAVYAQDPEGNFIELQNWSK